MLKDRVQNKGQHDIQVTGDKTMKNDYDAEYEADTLNYGSSGNGGLRWMSMLIMALVVFGFFSLVWYAYNASMSEQQQQAVAVIAPEQQEFKIKPENAGGMPIDNKDIEAYQLMRRQPSAIEEASKVERLLPEVNNPVIATAKAPMDPAKVGEVASITNAEAGIPNQPQAQPVLRETIPLSSSDQPTATITPITPATPAANAPAAVPAPAQSASVATASPVPSVTSHVTPDAANVTMSTPKPTAIESAKPAAPAQLPVATQQPVRKTVPKPAPVKPAVVASKATIAPADKPKVPTATKPKVVSAPAVSPTGKAYVQLGALRTAADAEALWKKLYASNKDVLGAATHSIESVNVAGTGTLFRLRARGFVSREAAIKACNGLKGRGLTCIVSQ